MGNNYYKTNMFNRVSTNRLIAAEDSCLKFKRTFSSHKESNYILLLNVLLLEQSIHIFERAQQNSSIMAPRSVHHNLVQHVLTTKSKLLFHPLPDVQVRTSKFYWNVLQQMS